MSIEIRRLTPDLAEDYVRFFDDTPHDDDVAEHKCYCVCWSAGDSAGRDFSTREKRRAAALELVRSGNLQGYLAYRNGRIVGWCNANHRADCLNCLSWRMFMGAVPTVESAPEIRVKSIFCFVVAPEMQRAGIATAFVERVCRDAAAEGFDFVEAYPQIQFTSVAKDFMGPRALYEKSGFEALCQAGDRLVMRKRIK